MAAPFGHAFIGMAVARWLGVRSPRGLAAAGLAGNLPDIDIPISWLLHRDGWKIHRTWTHTVAFALAAGAAMGLAGAFRDGSANPERGAVADALTGAVIVGTHLFLDKVPYVPDVPFGPKTLELPWANWLIDAVEWGVVAWLLWPKEAATDDGASR